MTSTTVMAPDGKPVTYLRIENDGLQLELMDWGATWLSCLVPMKNRTRREVLLGCQKLEDWFEQKSYLNATVGRYANRIKNARIERDGKVYQLDINQGGKHQLHGGSSGFSHRRWTILEKSREHVRFGILSADGDQGFPGNLNLRVVYRVLPGQRIQMECEGEVDALSPVGLTNHAYFNLDGVKGDIRQHRLQLAASRYLPIDAEMIPPGPLGDVAGTSFDFRTPHGIGERFLADQQQKLAGGYDHAFLLDEPGMDKVAAVLNAGDDKLEMRLYTDSPAVQFYSGNFLMGTGAREGGQYAACEGLCLEPGFMADSPNHPEWPQPDCWLAPGQTYRQSMAWEFIAK